MNSHAKSDYWAAASIITLNTTGRGRILTFGPSSIKSVRNNLMLYVPDMYIGGCVALLAKNSVSVSEFSSQEAGNDFSYYEAIPTIEKTKLSALRFFQQRPKHLNITSWDCKLDDLDPMTLDLFSEVRSLSLSCSNVCDSSFISLLSKANLHSLNWIDLSGNSEIGKPSVLEVCKKIKSLKIPNLQWMDLIGTRFNATPYIDGYTWRMTNYARELSEHFGPQEWMMLGSKDINMESIELLPSASLKTQPSRLSI